jgi:YD repeat-containing protein
MRIIWLCVLAVMLATMSEPAAAANAYTYDGLGRLSTATFPNGMEITYSYDAAGNRTSVVSASASNSPPTAVNDSETVAENTPLQYDPRTNDSDPDGDTLSITATSTPSHGGVVINSGTSLTYTPTHNYLGSDSFTYTISDGHGNNSTATDTMTVGANPLTAVNDSETAYENVALTYDPRTNDTDTYGDTLTITATSTPSHGSVVINSGTSLTYTPTNGYTGSDNFTYTVADAHNDSATATETITVSAPTQAPVANADTMNIIKVFTNGGTYTPNGNIDPRTNDTDPYGYPLTVNSVTQPPSGLATVTFTGTSVTYHYNHSVTVLPDYIVQDTFTYTVSDGFHTSNSATVTVHISVTSNQ